MHSQGFRLLQTGDLPWERHPRPGAHEHRKVLSIDPDTSGYVQLRYMPPSASDTRSMMFHPAVRELFFWIWGDLQSVNYSSTADLDPPEMVNRRHLYINRPPNSLHGSRPGVRSITGSLFLIWTSHGGEFEMDPLESLPASSQTPVPSGGWTMPHRVQADALEWAPHPTVGDWRVRELSRPEERLQFAAGVGPVFQVLIPPGSGHSEISLPASGRRNWLFGLHGGFDLATSDEATLPVREGTFLEWGEAARLRLHGRVQEEGAIVLCVGHCLQGPGRLPG